MNRVRKGMWARAQQSVALLALGLLACSGKSTVEIRYRLDKPVEREVFRNGFFATMDGEVEKMGTITGTFGKVRWWQEGEMLHFSRDFVFDRSLGYHKSSMPIELSWRLPLGIQAKGKQIHGISGHEHFEKRVVDNLALPDRFRNQLRGEKFPRAFDRAEKLRWEITHLLQGPVPVESNITAQLHKQGRLPLPVVEVDSVLTQGFARIEGERCLQYTVYLREKEPFPYFMWEQHAYGTDHGIPMRNYRPGPAFYQTAYQVSIHPRTGIPCRERIVRNGEHFAVHPERGDTLSFRSSATIEILYSEEPRY